MAKVLYGPVVATASGKVGGTVFTGHKLYGPLIKKKTSPGAANTPANAKSKTALSATAKTWNLTIMAAYRQNWINLAARINVPDRFGNPQHISGIAMFIRANKEIKVLSGSMAPASPYTPPPFLLDAPADQNTFDIGGFTPSFTPGPPWSFTLTVVNLPVGEDQLIVCASNITTPARKLPKTNRISLVEVFAPGHSNPFDFTQAWNAKYINAPQWGIIAVAAYSIRGSNGAAGPRYAYTLPIA
jgi:hypothetical protein